MWDVESAVQYAAANARPPFGIGRCAQYTRQAIEAGGLVLERTGSAKDYGPKLTAVGFQLLENPVLALRAGDVAIIESFPGNAHGHMAIYNGAQWISDFVQRELYPGPGYRKHKPAYRLFRYPAGLQQSHVGTLAAYWPVATNARFTFAIVSHVDLY